MYIVITITVKKSSILISNSFNTLVLHQAGDGGWLERLSQMLKVACANGGGIDLI